MECDIDPLTAFCVNIELPYLEISAKTTELFTGQSLHHKMIRILQSLPCKYPKLLFMFFPL